MIDKPLPTYATSFRQARLFLGSPSDWIQQAIDATDARRPNGRIHLATVQIWIRDNFDDLSAEYEREHGARIRALTFD
jgi:hypothetical protein